MHTRIDKDCLLASVSIDDIKSALADLYGVQFKREGGTNWRSSSNRSVRISERGLLWCNYATQEGGDYISAVRLLENIPSWDFPRALEAAAARIGYIVDVPPEEAAARKQRAIEKKVEREAAEAEQRAIEAAFLDAVNDAFQTNRDALERGLISPECIQALESRGMTPDMLAGQWCGYNASDKPIKTRHVVRFIGDDPKAHTIIKPHSFAFNGISKGVKSIAIDPNTGHKRLIECGTDNDGNTKTRADIICTPGYSFRLNDGDGCPLYLCEGEFDALTIAVTTGATVWATHANSTDMSAIMAKANGYTAYYLAFDNDDAGDKFTAAAKSRLVGVNADVVDVRKAFAEFKDVNDKYQSLRKTGRSIDQTIKALVKAFKEAEALPKSPIEKAAEQLQSLEPYLANHTFGRYCSAVDPQGAHEHTALYCSLALASIQCAATRFIRDNGELTRVIFAHLVGAPKSGKSYSIENAIVKPLRNDGVGAIDSTDIPEGDTLAPNTIVLHEVDDNSPEALRNSVQNAYCIREEVRQESNGECDAKTKTRITQRQNKPVLVRISKEFSLAQSDKKSAELRRFEGITNELADGICKASRALWRNKDHEKFPTCDGVKYFEIDASQFKTFKQFIRTVRDNASGYVRRSYMLKCGWNIEGATQIERIQNESQAKRTCMTREMCSNAASMIISPFKQVPEVVTLNTENTETLTTLMTLANALSEYRGRNELWLNPHADGVRDTEQADNVGDYAVTLLEWFSCLAAAIENRTVVTEHDLNVAACIARRVADCEMWVDGAESISDYTGQLISEFKERLSGCVKNRRPTVLEQHIIERKDAMRLWITWAPRNVGFEQVTDGKQKRKAFRLLTAAERDARDKLINSPDYHAPDDLAGVRIVCAM